MQYLTFLVEKVSGGYTAYAQEFSILAEGRTIKQTEQNAHEALKEQCEVTGENPRDFDVRFTYDVASALELARVNVTALSERSGLNGSVLSQYASGKRVASKKQRERIEAALHAYGRSLMELHLS